MLTLRHVFLTVLAGVSLGGIRANCALPVEPETVKTMIQFLSALREKHPDSVKQISEKFDTMNGVEAALGAIDDGGNQFEEVLQAIKDLHTSIMNNPKYGPYEKLTIGECTDGLMDLVLASLFRLFWPLQFLSKQCLGNAMKTGLPDWSNHKANDPNNSLGKWLTDANGDGYDGVFRSVKTNEPDYELAGMYLSKRGFQVTDLSDLKGSDIQKKLSFVGTKFMELMRAIYVYKPWVPKTTGDMMAFVQGFCENAKPTKELSVDFEEKSGLKPEQLEEIWKEVDKDVEYLTVSPQGGHATRLSPEKTPLIGLSPVNDLIYKQLSYHHVGIYIYFLKETLPQLIRGLKMLKTAMETWTESGDASDEKTPRDPMFYHGFRGGDWYISKSKLAESIDKLTDTNGGLRKLEAFIKDAKSTLHFGTMPELIKLPERNNEYDYLGIDDGLHIPHPYEGEQFGCGAEDENLVDEEALTEEEDLSYEEDLEEDEGHDSPGGPDAHGGHGTHEKGNDAQGGHDAPKRNGTHGAHDAQGGHDAREKGHGSHEKGNVTREKGRGTQGKANLARGKGNGADAPPKTTKPAAKPEETASGCGAIGYVTAVVLMAAMF